MTETRQPAAAAHDDEPARLRPAGVVVSHDEHGAPKLEVLDSFEQVYRLADSYTTTLFIELCRSRGLLPYRHGRQRESTVCVRASLSEHEALWARFGELSRQLHARLFELAHAFVHEHAPRRRPG